MKGGSCYFAYKNEVVNSLLEKVEARSLTYLHNPIFIIGKC